MTDESHRRRSGRSEPSDGGTIATLHVQGFDVQGGSPDITLTFQGAEVGSDQRRSVVQVELASADAEALLNALQRGVARSRQLQGEDYAKSAGIEQADSGTDSAARVRHSGVHYTEVGWTREQFEEAAEDMSDLQDIWDHDELDVYNDLLKG